MRRLFALLVVAVLAFYVAWPAWSAYRLAGALERKDAMGLEQTIDFPSVRDSLRPAVTTELSRRIDAASQRLGGLGQVLSGGLRDKMLPELVDQALSVLVTPETVIRFANDGGDISASIERVLADTTDQIGGIAGRARAGDSGTSGDAAPGVGGLLAGIAGKAIGEMRAPDGAATDAVAAPPAAVPAPATKPADTPRKFGLANIKSFGFAGPLGFDVAVARDGTSPKADGTIGFGFTGGTWKLTRVVPRL